MSEPYIPRQLTQAQHILGGEIRISAQRTPHLVTTINGQTYSVVWFERTKRWRVFWPYPANTGRQRRWDLLSYDDLYRWYTEKGSDNAPV